MPGKKLQLKCYLEGIEVPLIGIQINTSTNQASGATISVPPTNTAFDIRPRTHVHVFWYDDVDNKWYLLWEGEVLSIGFSKETSSRSVQLNCFDLSNYWDYITKQLLSLNSGVMYNPNQVMFYGDKSITIMNTGEPTLDLIYTALSKGDNLPQAMYKFMSYAADQLPYYKYVNDKLKVSDQLKMRPDTKVTNLLKLDQIMYLSQNIEGGEGFSASLRQIIAGFCAMVNYTYSSLGTPSSTGGMTSFVLKPNLFGCLPPRCNVVFPDMCAGIQYNRSFMDEPTRAMISAQMVAGESTKDNAQRIYTSPRHLAEAIAKRNDGRPTSEDLLRTCFTAEEIEKGIIPTTVNIPFPELFSKTESEKAINYMYEYGDYLFQMSRYASRSLSFTTELNPWMVCDFPCVVFDASRSFVANVNQVSHSIGADGGGVTQVQCGLARELNADQDATPYMPGWFSESYNPYGIKKTYQALFGCYALGDPGANHIESSKSATNPPPLLGTGEINIDSAIRTNISKAAATVYSIKTGASSEYFDAVKSNTAYSFADSYRRRKLVSMEDMFGYYGLSAKESTPPTQFDGPMFNYAKVEGNVDAGSSGPYKRDIISKYKKEISQGMDGR